MHCDKRKSPVTHQLPATDEDKNTLARQGMPDASCSSSKHVSSGTSGGGSRERERGDKRGKTGGKAKISDTVSPSEIAAREVRMAVARIVDNLGFTHATQGTLDVLSDVARRYILALATNTQFMTMHAGRSSACLRDVELAYARAHVDVDEMNEWMRQERGQQMGRQYEVPMFPVARTVAGEQRLLPRCEWSGAGGAVDVATGGAGSREAMEEGEAGDEGAPSSSSALRRPSVDSSGGLPDFHLMTNTQLGLFKGAPRSRMEFSIGSARYSHASVPARPGTPDLAINMIMMGGAIGGGPCGSRPPSRSGAPIFKRRGSGEHVAKRKADDVNVNQNTKGQEEFRPVDEKRSRSNTPSLLVRDSTPAPSDPPSLASAAPVVLSDRKPSTLPPPPPVKTISLSSKPPSQSIPPSALPAPIPGGTPSAGGVGGAGTGTNTLAPATPSVQHTIAHVKVGTMPAAVAVPAACAPSPLARPPSRPPDTPMNAAHLYRDGPSAIDRSVERARDGERGRVKEELVECKKEPLPSIPEGRTPTGRKRARRDDEEMWMEEVYVPPSVPRPAPASVPVQAHSSSHSHSTRQPPRHEPPPQPRIVDAAALETRATWEAEPSPARLMQLALLRGLFVQGASMQEEIAMAQEQIDGAREVARLTEEMVEEKREEKKRKEEEEKLPPLKLKIARSRLSTDTERETPTPPVANGGAGEEEEKNRKKHHKHKKKKKHKERDREEEEKRQEEPRKSSSKEDGLTVSSGANSGGLKLKIKIGRPSS